MAKALAVYNDKLIATPQGILVVNDAAEEPCCWCVIGCAWLILPHTVEVTVSEVFDDTGVDPPLGDSCAECDTYNDVYELPHDTFVGGEINPCAWRDEFIHTCTRPLSDPEGNTCDVQLRITVGIGACINGDGDCEVYVDVDVDVILLMGTCDPAVFGLSSSTATDFGEAGPGCGNNCPGGTKRIAIATGADCVFIDLRGQSLTIDQCSYTHHGNVKPTCFSDGGGSVTVQF